MFEICVIAYLWIVGAWGHYDLYSNTPRWDDEKTDWGVVICCAFWPLLIPCVLICEGAIALVNFLHKTGYGWR